MSEFAKLLLYGTLLWVITIMIYVKFQIDKEGILEIMSTNLERLTQHMDGLTQDLANVSTMATDMRNLIQQLRDQIAAGGTITDESLALLADKAEALDAAFDNIVSPPTTGEAPPIS